MRITNIYLANNVLSSIQHNMGRLARLNEQISTSKRILRPSDDPAVMGELLKIKGALSYREQYALNIEDGLSYMDVTDTSMSTLSSVLSQAWKYTIQAANDTNNPEDRKAIAQQIDKLIDQVVDLANATVGGRYVYGGTKNDIQPFKREDDKIIFNGNTAEVRREVAAATNYRIDAPGIGTGFKIDMIGTLEQPKIISRQSDTWLRSGFRIEVLGDDAAKAINIKIFHGSNEITIDSTNGLVDGILTIDKNTISELADLDGLKIDLNGCLGKAEYTFAIDNGVGVFGNGNWDDVENTYVVCDGTRTEDNINWGLFDTLFKLRDNLNNDDTEGLNRNVDQLKKDMDNVLRHQVAVGARYNHFDSLKTMLLDQEVKLTQSLDNIEGADIARLSIEYAQQQLAYNASLAIGANIMNTSLLNFLK